MTVSLQYEQTNKMPGEKNECVSDYFKTMTDARASHTHIGTSYNINFIQTHSGP